MSQLFTFEDLPSRINFFAFAVSGIGADIDTIIRATASRNIPRECAVHYIEKN